MSFRWGVLAILLLAAPASAAEPTFTGQVQPIERIVAKLVDASRQILAPAMFAELQRNVQTALDQKVLKGIDRKRPAAFYGTITEDPLATRLVILIPVSEPKAFLELLKTIGCEWKERDDGIISIVVSELPIQTFLKFVDGYAYLSLLHASPLADKERLAIKDLHRADDSAAITVRVRPALIPALYKDLVTTMLAQHADEMERNVEGVLPAKQAATAIGTLTTRWTSMILSQTREVSVRFDIDPKTALVSAELEVEPEPKSRLAASLAEYQAVPQTFAGLASPDAAIAGRFSIPVFNDEMKELASGLLWTGQMLIKMSESYALAAFSIELLKSLNRQSKSGNIDIAAALHGPDKTGKFTAVIGLSGRDTSGMERSLRKAVSEAQAGIQDAVKFSVAKVGEVELHEIDIVSMMPPDVQAVFGESSIVLAFAPQGMMVTFGPDARERMKGALQLKPQPASIGTIDLSGPQFRKLLDTADTPPARAMKQILQPQLDAIPLVRLDIATGKTLKLRGSISGLLLFGVGTR